MSVDKAVFQARLGELCKAWQANEYGAWEFDALVVATGKRPSDEMRYLKSVALHHWLFGLEVSDIVMVMTQTHLKIVCGKGRKAEVLETLIPAAQEAGVDLELLIIQKGTDGADQYSAAIEFLKGAGERLGGLPKVTQAGPVHDAFFAALGAAGIMPSDAALALAVLLAVHDETEAQNCRKSGFLIGHVMNWAVKQVEGIVDKERQVKHTKLADDISDAITNPQKKANIKLKADNCDFAYLPVVQSGGKFDMRIGAESDEAKLHTGVVLLHMGGKYNSYCTNLCRTLFFNPADTMEATYNAAVVAQQAAIGALKAGAPLSSVYDAAVQALEGSGSSHLVSKLGKSVGNAMGLELKENKLMLKPGNGTLITPGMVFNVSVGFSELENADAKSPKDKTYSVQVADTVLVLKDGSAPEVLTRFSNAKWDAVSYDISEEPEDDDGDDDSDGEIDASRENANTENLGRGRRTAATRGNDSEHQNTVTERKKKQDEMSARKTKETYDRLTAAANGTEDTENTGRSVMDTAAYTALTQVPPQRDLLVQVDKGHEALLVPILGVHVPLHITTVKAINFSQDGDHAYIRIQLNFMPSYDARVANPTAAFIKELSFRSSNPKHAQRVVQEAQTLRRHVLSKDKEEAERATLVKQQKLLRFTNRQPFRLPDVWIAPAIGSGRKTSGMLEAHSNGFRFTLPKGEILDIMYANIRHAFFQPAEKEMITLLHFHLKNPIMVGKKKTNDVQLFTEVMADTVALDGRSRQAYDPDEIEEEQRERERKNKINVEFQRFTKRVQDHWDRDMPRLKLEWDFPYRDLAFQGVSGRSTVHLMPTINCLVQLVESPYTVITQADIEIVNLERVGFNLKNFDMVIVFKDFSRDVHNIGSIPSDSLEDIKNWLTNSEIKFFESKMPLIWKPILKHITQNPESFLTDGGWAGFLDIDQGDSGEESEESEEFKPESDAGSDDDDSDVASDDESVVNSDSASGDEEGGSDDESEEEGKDWDELEAEARRSDKMREEEDIDEARQEKKRKGSGASRPGQQVKRRK